MKILAKNPFPSQLVFLQYYMPSASFNWRKPSTFVCKCYVTATAVWGAVPII